MRESSQFWGLHHFVNEAKEILMPTAVEGHLLALKQKNRNGDRELQFCSVVSYKVQSIAADVAGGIGMKEIIDDIIDREPLHDPSSLLSLTEDVDRAQETNYASLVPTLQMSFLWLQRLEAVLNETEEDYLQAGIGIQKTSVAKGLTRAKKCCTDLCKNFTADQFGKYLRARKSEKGLRGRDQETAGDEAMAKMELMLACEGAEFQARLFYTRDIQDYKNELCRRIMELMNVPEEDTTLLPPVKSGWQQLAINWGGITTEANVGLQNANTRDLWL